MAISGALTLRHPSASPTRFPRCPPLSSSPGTMDSPILLIVMLDNIQGS